MLLSLTTTHRPATELGFLLHKHPAKFQSFELNFGQAHVFYPEVGDDRCTACLLLDVDAVGLVRGKSREHDFHLAPYVNDRPYVASSFFAVAIAQVFGSALNGQCKTRPELASTPLPFEARLESLPVRGGEPFLRSVFEPLGYEVTAMRHPLDEHFPEWGVGSLFSVTIRKIVTLSELLSHLYVLIPVFDTHKHYFVGPAEVEKLLAKGEGWLATHPAKAAIARRYLGRHASLVRDSLARLRDVEEEPDPEPNDGEPTERPLRLNDRRYDAVVETLLATGAKRVLDLGCGEGQLLRVLLAEPQFERIVGIDVSMRALQIANRRLNLDRIPAVRERVSLWHGSLTYRDRRCEGFDAAAIVEVVEHLDPPRLRSFERTVFEFAQPSVVVLTTPNRDHNAVWESLPVGQFRHADHRFEWSRAEFQSWANGIGSRFGYAVDFRSVGDDHPEFGPPTQMGVFRKP
jgi:3' terminal RNA ribose 2'-O-methyltransferase Hen1